MAAGSRSEDDDEANPSTSYASSSSSRHKQRHHHGHRNHINNSSNSNNGGNGNGGGGNGGNGNGGNGNGGGGDDDDGQPRRPYSPVAETLFRKDLISAMKLPDNEPLAEDDYWLVTDTWKQEWEQGVQVPCNPGKLPAPHVSRLANPPHSDNRFTL